MANSCDTKSDSSEPSEKDRRVPPLYPVVLGSPETTLDIDSGSATSDSEEWTQEVAIPNGNAALPHASTINVENSSDVVIGPLTQFHGPVTIYQNINSDSSSSPAISGVECKSDIILNSAAKLVTGDDSSKFHHRITKYLAAASHMQLAVCVAVTLLILTTVVIGLALPLSLTSKNNDYPTPNATSTESPLGSHKIYSRAAWRGRSPLSTRILSHPTEYVLISHTAGTFCHSLYECSPVMQQIQAEHVSSGSPDIGYSFLIGGDGNIYVGRGWDAINFHEDNNIGVSFMGNFVYEYLTADMMSALKELLELGVELKKLRADYKLVAHNQTWPTLSPGVHIYQEIVKLPHFYTGPIDIN